MRVWPMEIPESSSEELPPIRVVQDKVSLWTWSVVRCSACGWRQVVKRSKLNGDRLQRLTEHEPCECMKPIIDDVVPTNCAVTWNER